ncbi:hypothetical protein ETAA8_14390 [Anatilimnocola aggregata]|uniref:Uncharacterized protein n=1 Tax=Anatilimnocola aggregata TaxID=2528021 RepID=A0A517Y834_9BACT|nr:hypothetical protein [Anatilimnocola aggregata]QDU26361.1 hypothetical protein ETAA8_14390 [Anatilimnocola aggregata]
MSDNKIRILVTFIDDSDDEPLGEVKLPPEQLPESFAEETTLHLDDDDWLVVAADPLTRAEFTQTKKLTLRLSRVEKIDPATILYSLPSITNELPACGDRPLTGHELAMLDDNWRQFELVSQCFSAQIDEELAAIQAIHEQESTGAGWRKVHVRKHPETPIDGFLSLSDLLAAFAIASPEGLTFHGAATRVEAGFAFTASDGQACYGLAPGGMVTVLGIAQTSLPTLPEESITRLAAVAEKFDLELVQWCRCARATADQPLFRQLLTENAE